ncbi:hypothetical protein D3C81_794940 [compost metagenome]
MPDRVAAARRRLALRIEVVPHVIDAGGARAASLGAGAGDSGADQRRRAPQAIGAARHIFPAPRVERHADIDASRLHGATVVAVGPVRVQVADVLELVGVTGTQFAVIAIVKQRRVRSHVLVPRAVQVIAHQAGIVEVFQARHVFLAAQDPARGGAGDGEQVILVVLHGRFIELLAQHFQQHVVARHQASQARLRDGEVVRIARFIVGGRMFVIDIDAIEEVILAHEGHHGIGQGVDAGRVDAAVRIRRGRVEAAAAGPAAHGNHQLDARMLLLVLRQQVEVALVWQGRVHGRRRHVRPREARVRIGRTAADGDF